MAVYRLSYICGETRRPGDEGVATMAIEDKERQGEGDEKLRSFDAARLRKAVREIIQAVGEDPKREGLVETPRRVAEMYAEVFSGLREDPADVLRVGFEEGHQELVLVKDIPFYSMCEHHFLPFHGVAHVGYIPNGRVVGLSKLARALEILARRPQLQERLTSQLADVIMSTLEPAGVAVVVQAIHLCMAMRGVRKPGSDTVTSAMRGVFRREAATRAEFMALIKE
jgi:GTP cyclohydrolase I